YRTSASIEVGRGNRAHQSASGGENIRRRSSEGSNLSMDARPAERRQPSPILLSFIAVVLVPVAVVAVYLFVIATDQYVSEFRFSLNSVDPPRLDPLSLLTG